MTVPFLGVDDYSTAANTHSLGEIRVDSAPSAFDVGGLRAAAADLASGRPSGLPNPSLSPGCSPLLRELVRQSGHPFAVQSEMANDGQAAGHQGGNAIDITASSRDLLVLADFIRAVPKLFAVAAIESSDLIVQGTTIDGLGNVVPLMVPRISLFVWSGAIVLPADRTTAMQAFATHCSDHIHLASSASRMYAALGLSVVASALSNDGSGVLSGRSADVYVAPSSAQTAIVTEQSDPRGASW